MYASVHDVFCHFLPLPCFQSPVQVCFNSHTRQIRLLRNSWQKKKDYKPGADFCSQECTQHALSFRGNQYVFLGFIVWTLLHRADTSWDPLVPERIRSDCCHNYIPHLDWVPWWSLSVKLHMCLLTVLLTVFRCSPHSVSVFTNRSHAEINIHFIFRFCVTTSMPD